MIRRDFLATLGAAAALPLSGISPAPSRRLKRVGLQLFSLRDDARRDLARTIADIAAVGYVDVELLGSFNNFGMPPVELRRVLDRNGLRAPSTHIANRTLDNFQRQLDVAEILGHEYVVVGSLAIAAPAKLDDYRRWADRLNEAGRVARQRGMWIGFHNHVDDFAVLDGEVAYDVFVERTDASVVRLTLDTGNLAMAGREPMDYLKRFGNRYWLFHIKDVPRLGAKADTEVGTGVVDFRKLLASIDRIDEKHLFVEQETYRGSPLESVRRDFTYIATLDF